MVEYWLYITPETHVRATKADKKAFYVFGPLDAKGADRTADEERKLLLLQDKYPYWYKRFLQLKRYNDYKRRLTAESILRGFWLRDAGMEITFYVPVPPSWRPGKKEKKDLTPHQSKPDIDNFIKSLFDTLKPQQDHAIWHMGPPKKLWINDTYGRIHIICHDIPELPQRDPRQLKLRFRYK